MVYIRDGKLNSASGDMLIIDKGTSSGLKVGDVLLALRARTFPVGTESEKKPPMESVDHYLGQVLVVRSEPGTATCRVLRTVEELRNGDTISR